MHKREKRYVLRAVQVDRDNSEQVDDDDGGFPLENGDATETDCRE